jgi:hypothetical protein
MSAAVRATTGDEQGQRPKEVWVRLQDQARGRSVGAS